MKKTLPLIALLCYLVAVAGCIAHIICQVTPMIGTMILFIVYVIGVLVLMAFATATATRSLGELFDNAKNNDAFESLANEETPKTDDNQVENGESLTTVFTDDDVTTDADQTAEAENAEVADTADEDTPEDGREGAEATDETAEEASEAPVILPATGADDEADKDEEKSDEDAPEDEDADEENSDSKKTPQFKEARLKKSYTSKLIQAADETKGYYSTVKNAFLSYKKVTSTSSSEHERFRRGRATVGIIKLRGKTILVYLALDPAQFENTMYVGEDVSSMSKYADVPFLYRVNGPRKAARAVKLIAMVAEKFGLENTPEPANEDYTKLYPYESDEELIKKGLIVDRVEETARKAEEAKKAAEEAEKAAEQAINDAIKAKESAENAAARAAETAEAHGEEADADTPASEA